MPRRRRTGATARRVAPLGALHGKGDRAAGADRVEPQLIAPLRSAEHDLGIVDFAERAQGEQVFILQPHALVLSPSSIP